MQWTLPHVYAVSGCCHDRYFGRLFSPLNSPLLCTGDNELVRFGCEATALLTLCGVSAPRVERGLHTAVVVVATPPANGEDPCFFCFKYTCDFVLPETMYLVGYTGIY